MVPLRRAAQVAAWALDLIIDHVTVYAGRLSRSLTGRLVAFKVRIRLGAGGDAGTRANLSNLASLRFQAAGAGPRSHSGQPAGPGASSAPESGATRPASTVPSSSKEQRALRGGRRMPSGCQWELAKVGGGGPSRPGRSGQVDFPSRSPLQAAGPLSGMRTKKKSGRQSPNGANGANSALAIS